MQAALCWLAQVSCALKPFLRFSTNSDTKPCDCYSGMKQDDAIVKLCWIFFSFFPPSLLSRIVTVHCHRISLTQRNANTELKELVQVSLMPSGDIVLLVRDESRSVCEKHLGFYLKSSSHTLSNSWNLFKPGTFSKTGFYAWACIKGHFKKFFIQRLCPHIWMQLLLRGLTMSSYFGLVGKVQFIDNPYFACQVN